MRRPWWFGLMLVPGAVWASEPVHGCFRSAAEAAVGVASVGPLIANDAMNGAREGGFRVEGIRRDVLLGRSWAVVRSCEHPERPAVLVEMLRQAGAVVAAPAEASVARAAAGDGEGRGRSRARELVGGVSGPAFEAVSAGQARSFAEVREAARAELPVLIAGARVQVVRTEQNVRLSMLAVAERSASMGERVRLRVVRESGEGEQFVVGVVRGAGLVEMEAGR